MHSARTRRGVLVVLLAALTSGCRYRGPVTIVDRNVSFDQTSGDALIVFAMTQNLVVTLVPGTDDGVNWRCVGAPWPVQVRPQDGFVVARLPPRTGKQRYAITRFSTDVSHLTAWRLQGQILAFDAVPGQVTYVGALSVEFADGQIDKIVSDPDGTDLQAEAFMASKFVNVRAPFAKGRMDWLYLDNPC